MNPDLALPLITSIMWLILCGAALASYRLRWSQMAKMGLAWLVIFGAVFVVVEWFFIARDTASALL